MAEHPIITSRRLFLAATGTAAAAIAVPSEAQAAPQSAVESANEKVVNDFCAAWESKDAEKIGSFLHDDCKFRMIDEPPADVQTGKTNIMEGIGGFIGRADSAKFEVVRSVAMGNTILNDRWDHFDFGGNKQSFHISGFFLIKDGKIREWQDYKWPEVDEAEKS